MPYHTPQITLAVARELVATVAGTNPIPHAVPTKARTVLVLGQLPAVDSGGRHTTYVMEVVGVGVTRVVSDELHDQSKHSGFSSGS